MDSGLWNPEGGSETLAQADVDFYAIAGALTGPADQLKWQDFWDLGAARSRQEEARWLACDAKPKQGPAPPGSVSRASFRSGRLAPRTALLDKQPSALAAFLSHPLTLRVLSALAFCLALGGGGAHPDQLRLPDLQRDHGGAVVDDRRLLARSMPSRITLQPLVLGLLISAVRRRRASVSPWGSTAGSNGSPRRCSSWRRPRRWRH